MPQDTTDMKPKRKPRKKKVDYAQIHSKPLPLSIYPLPAFHPSNPISLLRLCYTFLSQLLSPPTPPPRYTAYFSPETRSLHVTNPAHVRALWEMGFFGKGSLSRSEPSWLEREKARLQAERGGKGVSAAEDVTRARREERRLFKLERARLEREAIERQRAVEEGRVVKGEEGSDDLKAKADGGETMGNAELYSPLAVEEDGEVKVDGVESIASGDATIVDQLNHNNSSDIGAADTDPLLANGSHKLPNGSVQPTNGAAPFAGTTKVSNADTTEDNELEELDVRNQEHLQLTLEEAFFLSFALGVLDIVPYPTAQSASPSPLSPTELLALFASQTAKPTPNSARLAASPKLLRPTIAVNDKVMHARAVSHAIATAPLVHDPTETSLRVPINAAPLTPQPPPPPPEPTLHLPDPDNTFLLSYTVYHHFRSLGWVVRSGVKFGVDYLLYNRGPVFSHAEFGVMIIPSYSDGYWSTRAGMARRCVKEGKDWWWLHAVNRVQSSVYKTLVLCYVEVPAPMSMEEVVVRAGGEDSVVDVAKLCGRYKVREFAVRRWLINRSRD